MEINNHEQAKKLLTNNNYRLKEEGGKNYAILPDNFGYRLIRKIGIRPPIVATLRENQVYQVGRERRIPRRHHRNIGRLLNVDLR